MTLFTLFALAAAMFLLAASPGPGVFATVARALACGFSQAAVLVLGIVVGDLIFLLLAVYGLSAIAELLGDFFSFVKYAGGLYLIWLGFTLWRSPVPGLQEQTVPEHSFHTNFLSGLIITLANPKVILFYLGFLPTFIDLTLLTHLDVLAISIVIITVLSSVLLFYAWTASCAGQLLKNKNILRGANRCGGTVMMVAGGALLLKD